jgi:hypothetical protein
MIWAAKTKDRSPDEGRGDEEPGDPGEEGGLDGQEDGEAEIEGDGEGDEHIAAAEDDEDGGTVLDTDPRSNGSLVGRFRAHKDLKRRARWPSPNLRTGSPAWLRSTSITGVINAPTRTES